MQVSKLFEPKKIGETSLGGKVVSYFFLLVWATIVIFPIYWIFITSFKFNVLSISSKIGKTDLKKSKPSYFISFSISLISMMQYLEMN